MIAEIVTKNLMLSSQLRCPKSAIPDKRIPALSVDEQKALVDTLAKHKKWGTRNEYSKQILDTYADVYGSLNSASMDQLEKHLEV